MTQLDEVLGALASQEGAEHLILVGRDGLLIHQYGAAAVPMEATAAMIAGLQEAGAAVGRASGRGELATAVIEYESGVVIVSAVSADVALAVLVRAGVAFGPLLRAIRREREALARLL